jgi:hypothetical protein
MLAEIGLEKTFAMVNVSAAMARPLADNIITVEMIRKLGPAPWEGVHPENGRL